MAKNEQAARRTTITTPSDREIRVERAFDAPREELWRSYTDPALLAQWWGRGNELAVEKWEFEKGGHWRFVEHGPDGVHGFEGRFREIAPLERIAQTFEWDGMPGHVAIETMVFEEVDGDRTRIISTSLFHTKEERDGMLNMGMEDGMEQSYAALDRLLAREDRSASRQPGESAGVARSP